MTSPSAHLIFNILSKIDLRPRLIESETFDLGGCSVSTITSNMLSAFSDPLPLGDMIRITFVTGAGKLGRAKYDDNAARALTSALRELGFEDDRGASCVVECAGSFKLQHDTGKNLKTVVVFPRILGKIEEDDGNSDTPTASILKDGSQEHMISMSSVAVFTRMLASKCPSWNQKKECIVMIGSIWELVEALDAKLLKGVLLTGAEQELYDEVSADGLSQKDSLVKSEMQKHVEEGRITRFEKSKMLAAVKEKLAVLDKDLAEATEQKKPKKVQKLKAQREKITARERIVEEITPVAPHALRHEAEILKLRKEMKPIIKLQDEARGRLMSLKETAAITRKEEIEEEIEQLEEKSRGWFEDDAEFLARVEVNRAVAAEKARKAAKKKPSGGARSGNSAGKMQPIKWSTPAPSKKNGKKKASTNKPSMGNSFAAMMMDSDSD